jgi:hypothetical protein
VEKFIQKHEHNILGTLSGVDRIVFKGYLPITGPTPSSRFFAATIA